MFFTSEMLVFSFPVLSIPAIEFFHLILKDRRDSSATLTCIQFLFMCLTHRWPQRLVSLLPGAVLASLLQEFQVTMFFYTE